MDDLVRQAMAKWPNVPDCFGWLGLDARGGWYMRDDRVQAQGPFAAAKGSLLRHEKLVEFIHRNYDHDGQGRWYFQNGPQRVFVTLDYTPWVWRLHADGRVESHTGLSAQVRHCVLDEEGYLFLDTDLGLGRVHSQDMDLAAQALEVGRWVPSEMKGEELPRHFGFVRSPAAMRAGPAGPAA